jgi:mRNA-degrading endonuclease RelE of RelBE toxin-antitoxin system
LISGKYRVMRTTIRIRMGHYRIGCEIEAGNKITFYRVKDRKDIYRVFP